MYFCEFEARLIYIVNSRTAGTIKRDPVSKTNKQTNKLSKIKLKLKIKSWRHGSEVKSASCSCRERFNSQHPHDSSQLSLTPVPEDLISAHRQAKQ